MNPEEVSLSSVNWEHGMLLTPTHFLRQEKYFEAGLLWVLRYATNAYGLVGGGPRLPEAERGAVRHDPIVVLDEDDKSVGIAVTQCRALTPAGCIIEIEPLHPVQRRFPKTELENVLESSIYLVADPAEKQVYDGPVDEFNPQMKTERRPLYALTLQVHPDSAPYAVAVGRLRRQRYGAGYEKDSSFIPACTSMASYSELAAAWRKIVDTVTLLTERYTELNRAMREFLVLFTERGIDTQTDVDTASFVERMTIALHNCIYDLIDPLQAPQQFFGKLRRLFHAAASYFELTPAVQQYYETLKQTGETEFITLVEQQERVLQSTRSWAVHEDLGVEVRSAAGLLDGLQRLERALEGKYIDFRLSPSLEAMNFVFDRGGKALYKLASKTARTQGVGDELTMYFSNLRLEGRDKYRLILVGERQAVFEKGTRITVDIRINESSAFHRPPEIVSCESRLPDQCNFDFDFDAPDVPTITDLQVKLPAHLPIRTALLFTRHRFWAQRVEEPLRPVEPLAAPRVPPGPDPTRPPAAPDPAPPVAGKPAPWDPRPFDRPRPPDPQAPQPQPPVRRRRLE